MYLLQKEGIEHMDQTHGAHERLNTYAVEKYGNCTNFMKVRALVEHMGQTVYEVTMLSVNKDGTLDFTIEFQHPNSSINRLPILTMDDMLAEYDTYNVDNSKLQSLVTAKYHPNAEKMIINSPVALLSSHYSHVTNNFGNLAIEFPSERVIR